MTDEAIIRYGAEIIVRQVAPEELPFFPEISDAYFAAPERVLTGGGAGGGPLRFGAAELVDLMSVVALAVMNATVEHTVSETLKGVKPSALPGALKRLFGLGRATGEGNRGRAALEPRPSPEPRQPSDPPLSLTPEQLAQVREVAIEVACRHGAKADKAEVMANAVVAMLLPGVTSSAGQAAGVEGRWGNGVVDGPAAGAGDAAAGRPADDRLEG